MELRTQAIDRLLEALTPPLAAELERVSKEIREGLEAEFQTRLQSALRDAELATLHLAEVRLEEAVASAREEMRIQLTDSFTEQMNFTVQQTRDAMGAKSDEDMKSAVANWTAERALLQGQVSQWQTYAEAQRQLSSCATQSEILVRFLKLSEPFADILAIYVSKSDGLALWKARGNRAFPDLVSPGTIDPELYFKPAVVRDKMVVAVCAVRPCKVEPLNFLVSCLEWAIEVYGLKLRMLSSRPPASEAAPQANV